MSRARNVLNRTMTTYNPHAGVPSPLRVCVDGRLGADSLTGGHFVILGLLYGFAELQSNESYFVLASEQDEDRLRPFCGDVWQILRTRQLAPMWKRGIRMIPGVKSTWQRLRQKHGTAKPRVFYSLEQSDGTIEKAKIDVMHFPLQDAFTTKVPFIYQPHDLQHLHYPQYFSESAIARRERVYRDFCARAELASVATSWGKHDLVEKYEIQERKVAVIPFAPLPRKSPSFDDMRRVAAKYKLPERFLFYPACTWEHKNHLGLLAGIEALHRDGLDVNVVCVGGKTDFDATIQRAIGEAGMERQFRMLGYVTDDDIGTLYKLCSALVFPSKFEGWGLPVTEAFSLGVPVVASRIPPIEEQVGNAALLFDPKNTREMSEKIALIWRNTALRNQLSVLGEERAKSFSWRNTARLFRAHYRAICGMELGEEDRFLIDKTMGFRGQHIAGDETSNSFVN